MVQGIISRMFKDLLDECYYIVLFIPSRARSVFLNVKIYMFVLSKSWFPFQNVSVVNIKMTDVIECVHST